MPLTLQDIQKAIEKPSKKPVIDKAIALQERHRFHSETNVGFIDGKAMINSRGVSAAATAFLDWVKGILPEDKFRIFVWLFRLPNPTQDVVDDAYRELERVFDSRNASFDYRFTDRELYEDWLNYRRDKLHEPNIWHTEGWKRLRTAYNSILVVDMPVEQRMASRPEPYFYWLGIEHVIDYQLKERSRSEFDWLIFRQPENRIAVFDEESIRVFQLDDKGKIAAQLSEAHHNLRRCPARFFWSDSITECEKDIKKNPITKELSNLDWLLFFKISKRHLDTYASYPIYSAYEHDCDFMNNATGEYCDGGFLRNAKDEYVIDAEGRVAVCPVCSHKTITGPGSFVEVPKPDQSNGTPDMRNPVGITTIDEASLSYNVKEEERLQNSIIVSIVGSGGTVSEKEAINETQVAANFESKTSVLNSLKTNYEAAQKFVEDCICELRYGPSYLGCSINWGTEFYIFTAQELYKKLKTAKDSGASISELDAIRQQITEVEYKNNPIQYARMQLLKQLEPYQDTDLVQLSNMLTKGLVDTDKFMIKLNFEDFVMRFERENIDILEFGKELPLAEKIKVITNKFIDYVHEQKTVEQSNQAAEGPQGAANEA